MLALAGGGVVIFLALTALVVVDHIGGLDFAVRRWMHAHYDPTLRTAARVITDVLSPAVDAATLVAVAAITASRRRRVAPIAVAVAMICVTSVVVIATKHGVGRPSPYFPRWVSDGRSFPSGHTAATLVFLGTAVMVAVPPGRRRRLLLAAVAGLTTICAVSLVYDGFHWLSDTIASAALGVTLLTLLCCREDLNRSTEQRRPPASRTRSRRS
jgi:undecaprenyl-diphosphatase